MKKLSCLPLPLIVVMVKAQTNSWIAETWADKPAIHTIDTKYNNESAVIILDKRRMEYLDEAKDLVAYRTFHRIIHINDDKGIETFNKVYLGVTDNADIVDIKARTILPSGKIIDVDKNNIKDQKEEDGSMYKIFAMEGLEKGCEVEFFYTYKKDVSFFGREVLQGGFPVLDARLELASPRRLIFETKYYNGKEAGISLDTSIKDKRVISIWQKDMPGMEDEKYGAYKASLQRVEYKLAYNISRSTSEKLFTWNELAKRAYDIYATFTDKELSKVSDFIKSNGWEKLASDSDKIIAVENYLKKNFASREDIHGDDASNIEKILKSKIASFRGLIRLFGAIYKQLNIGYQFVLAGDRDDFGVDRNFENWDNAENQLMYFTSTKKYMSPTRFDTRYPWIYPYWGNTNGLFCVGTTIGSFTTAIAEVRNIPLEDYSQSASNIEAAVKINPDNDTLMIDIKQIYLGYAASVYRASFNFTSAEEQRQIIKELVKFGTNSENIVTSKIENQDYESYGYNKPFIFSATVKAGELVEKAGNKLLFKVGEIIGPQVEMYQEKPRQTSMEMPFPHVLDRKIKVTIPDGYVVKNLNDLGLKNEYRDHGEITMGFTTEYKQEGNVITIHVLEQYRRTSYPLDQYEDFKKIINTSADFNKITLVLEKK